MAASVTDQLGRKASALSGSTGSRRRCPVRRPKRGERSASTSFSMKDTWLPHRTSISWLRLPLVSQNFWSWLGSPLELSHR